MYTCRLPEVKKFLYDDLEAKYENTYFKKVPGKSPQMMFFDKVSLIHMFICAFTFVWVKLTLRKY